MSETETYRRGSELRRQLLGDSYVERANKATYADPVMKKFIDVATETVFGALWTRPGLDLKTRTLVCVITDAATGRFPELAIHVRMALRQGCVGLSDVSQLFIQPIQIRRPSLLGIPDHETAA